MSVDSCPLYYLTEFDSDEEDEINLTGTFEESPMRI
jgi:hypothetical protein